MKAKLKKLCRCVNLDQSADFRIVCSAKERACFDLVTALVFKFMWSVLYATIVKTKALSSFSGFNKKDSIPVSSKEGGPSTFSRDHPRSYYMSAEPSTSGQTIESSPLALVVEANLLLSQVVTVVSGRRREMAKLLGRCVRACGGT